MDLIGHVTDAWSTTCQRFSSFLDHRSSSKNTTLHGVEYSHRAGPLERNGGSTKEQVGRATWTLLHTLAAQYPEHPTSRQKRDARNLIDIMTRMYPCGECAEHFSEVVKAYPPRVNSRQDFSQWMCRVHNVVNRSLGKPEFNCTYISSRWEGIECDTPKGCSLR